MQTSAGATTEVEKTVWQRGELVRSRDRVVNEAPIALVYNGISHVVMMATPTDLEDFALGFSLSEGILNSPDELLGVEIVRRDNGIELNLRILNRAFDTLKHRRRNLTGRTGCGLCGAESLDQAIIIPPAVERSVDISHQAIDRAIQDLAEHQPIQQLTGACHGAAWCDIDGQIQLLREDVGRHNALDKLIGAICRLQGVPGERGFILVTSRASYEMVAKTARMNIPALISVSAPTSLAIELANKCGVQLTGFTAPGRHVQYTTGAKP